MYRNIFIPMLFLIFCVLNFPARSYADKVPKCFIGTYLIEEASGTMSLWTLGARETISPQAPLRESLISAQSGAPGKKTG